MSDRIVTSTEGHIPQLGCATGAGHMSPSVSMTLSGQPYPTVTPLPSNNVPPNRTSETGGCVSSQNEGDARNRGSHPPLDSARETNKPCASTVDHTASAQPFTKPPSFASLFWGSPLASAPNVHPHTTEEGMGCHLMTGEQLGFKLCFRLDHRHHLIKSFPSCLTLAMKPGG